MYRYFLYGRRKELLCLGAITTFLSIAFIFGEGVMDVCIYFYYIYNIFIVSLTGILVNKLSKYTNIPVKGILKHIRPVLYFLGFLWLHLWS